MDKSKTIVLIHGNFVNEIMWTGWKKYYEQKGYKVYTPSNPGHEGIPSELRSKVNPDLTRTGFIDVRESLFQKLRRLVRDVDIHAFRAGPFHFRINGSRNDIARCQCP